MAKRPATRSTKSGMVQTAVWLPKKMQERLVTNRPMADEIRDRISESFDREDATKRDPTTARLTAAIAGAAKLIASDGSWSEYPEAFAVFKTAIDTLLDHFKPTSDKRITPQEINPEDGPVGPLFVYPGLDPKVAGRQAAHFALQQLRPFEERFADYLQKKSKP
jgi:hypothetical protein